VPACGQEVAGSGGRRKLRFGEFVARVALKFSTEHGEIQRVARLKAERSRSGFAEQPIKTGFRGAEKCVWTLAARLHIRMALPIRAN
jgi:hypothetical protein